MHFSPLPDDFICGVVEGFYGRPWTPDQRRSLYSLIKQLGLNTYLYAPKDDVKHRACWKELYTPEEGKLLAELISASQACGVRFVYAISPGLDVQIPAIAKVGMLKEKLQQVRSFGCSSFALLFDDIYLELCPEDTEEFNDSPAAVQSWIANEIYEFLEKPNVFLFCPTEYCTSRAMPNILQSDYLQTIGRWLDPGIDVMWTGPMVVSKFITPQCLVDLIHVIRRKPVIWDNIHANDYDQKCLYLGPYDGRSLDLCDHIKGVLTNPNCEFEANYVAFHTMAQWIAASYSPNNQDGNANTMDDRNTNDDTITADEFDQTEPNAPNLVLSPTKHHNRGYDPRNVFKVAIANWLDGPFYTPKASPQYSAVFVKPASFMPVPPTEVPPAASCGSDAGMSEGGDTNGHMAPFVDSVNSFAQKSGYSDFDETSNHSTEAMDFTNIPPSNTRKVDKDNNDSLEGENVEGGQERLTPEEVEMVADLFYLPFEAGEYGMWIIDNFTWLRLNAHFINSRASRSSDTEMASKWHSKADEFSHRSKVFNAIVEKICQTPNRSLLFDVYPYVSDMRCVIGMLASYVKWLSSARSFKEAFMIGQQEPWMFRGGLTGELQRLLPTEGAADTAYKLPPSALNENVFIVRPYIPRDESPCYEVCRKYFHNLTARLNEASFLHDLIPDVNIGSMLTLSPAFCFVLVEAVSGNMVAYCFAALEAKQFYERCANAYFIDMSTKYPSEIVLKIEDESIVPVVTDILNRIHSYEPPDATEALLSRYPSLLTIHYDKDLVENFVVLRQLLAVCLAALKANGSVGVHTLLRSSQCGEDSEEQETVISLLGFQELPGTQYMSNRNKENSHSVFGRSL